MARTEGDSEVEPTSEAESDSDKEDEVLSPFSPYELKATLLEMMEKYNYLRSKHKILKKELVEPPDRFERTISELNEKNFSLVSSNLVLRSKISKLEEEVISSTSNSNNEKRYEKSFQYFFAKGINRSKMASMIYGVSRNKREGLGYTESYRKNKTLIAKPKSLYEQFVPSGIKVISSNPAHSEAPKVSKTSGKKTNKKGPRKWVLKNKI